MAQRDCLVAGFQLARRRIVYQRNCGMQPEPFSNYRVQKPGKANHTNFRSSEKGHLRQHFKTLPSDFQLAPEEFNVHHRETEPRHATRAVRQARWRLFHTPHHHRGLG